MVGVLDDWSPSPKFYDLNNGSFDEAEDAYIPFKWGEVNEMQVAGNTNCWKSEPIESAQDFRNSECVWIQMWAELPTAAARDRYQAFLDNYVRAQKAAGRMPRPLNNQLFDVDQWLDVNHVVKRDNRVLIGIALLFLGVCLVNVVGLLLAKFMNGAALTGLRRALGASRRDIVRQHLAEVLIIGLAGGVLGLGLAWLGLAGIRAHLRRQRRHVREPDAHGPDGRAGDPWPLAAGRTCRGPVSRLAHRPDRARRLPEDAVRRPPWKSDPS